MSLVARSMEAEFNKRLSEYGITRVAWAVFGAIHYDEQKTPSDLADFLSIDRAAITRLLGKLETQALITRTPTQTDRRSVSLDVTPKGRALLEEIARESKAVNDLFTAGISPVEITQYIATLKKMLANGQMTVSTL